MKNVYSVTLAKPIETTPGGFSGKSSRNLYVVASSFEAAERAAKTKYPGIEVTGMMMLNYAGLPIVAGD